MPSSLPTLPSITTPNLNLHLRPLTSSPQDTAAVTSLRTNPRIFHWLPPHDLENPLEASTWLHARLHDPLSMIYVVELQAKGQEEAAQAEIIGLTGSHHLPQIGYIFHPDHWGRGYATEALKGWMGMYWQMYPDGHPGLSSSGSGSGEDGDGGIKGEGGKGGACLRAETKAGKGGEKSARVLGKCGFVRVGRRDVQKGEDGGDGDEEGKRGTERGTGGMVVDCWRAERPGV